MKLVDALAATAELCGTRLSEVAVNILLDDLSQYPEEQIIPALARCRKELKGKLTVHEVLSRVDDGRPGPDEAFALLVWDDWQTSVLTDEMSIAQGDVRALWNSGDKAGARLAFREAYIRRVNEARERRIPVVWKPSLGWDKAAREGPIREAVAKGRMTTTTAQRFIPSGEVADITGMVNLKGMTAPARGRSE